ncbi:MAG TPA: phasin family protein [Bradyrhizobium sp.]|nr:phasin family protein [Bradyrhizobium sp.]
MLKKAKAEAQSSNKQGGGDRGIPKAVLESSHQIWLAGLGAFAKAQQGGKQVFDMLVKQGEILEAKTRSAASQTADAAREAAKAKAKEMQTMAGGTWDKLEQVFEDRVSRALARLGVYTSSDVEKLSERVNELSEAVNALLKAQGVRRPPASSMRRTAKGTARSATRTASETASGETKTAASTEPSAPKKAKKTPKAAT